MSEIPTISVTKDEAEFDDNGDNEINEITGAATDIEDMESNDEGELMMNLLSENNNIKGIRSPFATDIEDYNDSCSENEESAVYPELKVSLQKFLHHGASEERIYNNEIDGTVEIKTGNFLSLNKPSGLDDCPTDYENYSIASDDENIERKSLCVDLSLLQLDNNNTEDHAEQVKDSDEELSKTDCLDYSDDGRAGSLSENEFIEISDLEEEMQITCSSSDNDSDIDEKYPIIDVTFASNKGNRKTHCKPTTSFYLEVGAVCEESLTDIERIDLSTAEDSGDEDDIPIARAVVLDSAENSITDVEDFNFSECAKSSDDYENLNHQHLPPVHREMVLIKENENGDPITNVVAMENGFRFGLTNNRPDEMLTDVEDLSSANDYNSDVSTKDIPDFSATLENDVVLLSENVKNFGNKRNEHPDNLTDTEEICVAGMVRRKKYKSKTQNKTKQRHYQVKNVASDECNVSLAVESEQPQCTRNLLQGSYSLPRANVNEILNESYTVVHEKSRTLFNVEKEKNYIKGLKDCLETHTDVEYIEVELLTSDQ